MITPGHYQTTAVYHRTYYAYSHYTAPNYWYDLVLYSDPGDPNYTTGTIITNHDIVSYGSYVGTEVPGSSEVFYTYVQTWVDPVYETQASGYWEYPAPYEVVTGTPGRVSAIAASIADTMIGGIYVSRPLIA